MILEDEFDNGGFSRERREASERFHHCDFRRRLSRFFSFRPFQTMWWMERVCSPVFYLVERTGTEYLPPAPSTGAAIGNLMHDMGRALFHVMNTGETWNETDSIILNSVKIK